MIPEFNNELLIDFHFTDIPRLIKHLHDVNVPDTIEEKLILAFDPSQKKYVLTTPNDVSGGGKIYLNSDDQTPDYLINKLFISGPFSYEVTDHDTYGKIITFSLNLHDSLEYDETNNVLKLAEYLLTDISDLNDYAVSFSNSLVGYEAQLVKIMNELTSLEEKIGITKDDDWTITDITLVNTVNTIQSDLNDFKTAQTAQNDLFASQISDLQSRVSALENA